MTEVIYPRGEMTFRFTKNTHLQFFVFRNILYHRKETTKKWKCFLGQFFYRPLKFWFFWLIFCYLEPWDEISKSYQIVCNLLTMYYFCLKFGILMAFIGIKLAIMYFFQNFKILDHWWRHTPVKWPKNDLKSSWRGVKITKSKILKEIMKLECSNFTNMYYKLVGEKNNNICAILK